MAELILIRHSITEPNPELNSHEWTLTELGRERCKILAEALRPYPIRHIYTSDEAKAIVTGAIIAESFGIKAEIEPKLAETKRSGLDFMGSQAEFKQQVREAMRYPNEKRFGDESFSAARERFLEAMDARSAMHPNETIALVSHGRVLAMVLAQFSGEDPSSIWDSLKMPAYAVISLPEKQIRALVREVEG